MPVRSSDDEREDEDPDEHALDLCTAIPIQALRYRFAGYEVVNVSRSVPGIAHGTCRW